MANEQYPVKKRRRIGAGLVVAALAFFGLVAGMLYVADPWDIPREAALYDPARPPAEVVFEGERWVPVGPAVTFADMEMEQVGVSDDGHAVFANVYRGGGGGAGQATHYYMRALDGDYVPLVRPQAEPVP